MIRLRVLGSIELHDADGNELRPILAQPKRLALLVYLAAAAPRGFHRRDMLLSLFWPELDAQRGRAALNQAVRFLRRELHGSSESILISRGTEDLGIDAAALWCDAAAFRDAVDAGRDAEALDLYRGDFLQGFFSDEAPGFEEWSERERTRLRAAAARSARAMAEARESQANFTTAIASARRAVELSDVDERVVRELLELLDRLGDRAGAVHAYEEFARRLATEYDAEPAAETTAVIDRIRSRATVGEHAEHAGGRGGSGLGTWTGRPAAGSPQTSLVGGGLTTWHVIRELGSGGMAKVYLAQDVKHDRHVALKVMRPELAHTFGVERFLREIQITAQLAHPHILPLIDSGAADGILYLVTPYIAGESLRARLRREARLPVDEALRIAREIADALGCAHRAGIVHRDIKPENILLADGHAVVADFGVACALSASGAVTPISESDPAAVVGSHAYMSPEQSRSGQSVDARADVYSLGRVLYEMLTGTLPNDVESPGVVLERSLAEELKRRPRRLGEVRPDTLPALGRLITTCLARDPAARFENGQLLRAELQALTARGPETTARLRKGRRVRVAAALAVVAFSTLAGLAEWRARRERWVFVTAIPDMQRLLDAGDIEGAHKLARTAATILPNDSMLIAAWSRISIRQVIRTSPPGASVYRAAYGDTTTWELLGTTPTDSVWLPGRGGPATALSIYRIDKPGFVTRFLAAGRFPSNAVLLDSVGVADSDMVRVDSGTFTAAMPGLQRYEGLELGAFLMDRAEITNRQFKAFVEARGYERPELWDAEFRLQGRLITRDEALARFVDRTGRRGPATWEGGGFPPGEAAMPVGGVSWYEARAYARWTGKALPTVFHWKAAAGQAHATEIVPHSNFESQGPRPAGRSRAMSPFGTFDMAGNVREWCINATGTQRYILGGGWNDPTYQFIDAHAQDPFDRSVTNGIRLVQYLRDEPNLELATRPLERSHRDFSKERPVSDAVFEGFRRMYDYDHTPLKTTLESRDSTDDWVREKVSFDAAYGDDRVPAFVYLPRKARPPFQAVVFFPGSGAQVSRSTRPLSNLWMVDFVIRSGRALVYPIYKDTYERRDSLIYDVANTTVLYRDHVLMWAKDLRRSLDYLATRSDIDTARVAYVGVSWGGYLGGIFPAVEPRIKTALLLGVGLQMERARPEAEPVNFLPRVTVPVLMLNGKHDHYYPTETSQKPFYELLGTPAPHKRYVAYAGGHLVPRPMYVAEVLNWLDMYLGPVR